MMETRERRAASPLDQAYDANMIPIPEPQCDPRCDPRASPPPETEMAPRVRKPKTIADIRAEAATYRRAALPVSSGSAFDKLNKKNDAFNSNTRRDEFNEKFNSNTRKDEFNEKRNETRTLGGVPLVKMPVAKTIAKPTRVTKVRKRIQKAIPPRHLPTPNAPERHTGTAPQAQDTPIAVKPPTIAKPPVIESWRTAAGFMNLRKDQAVPTPFLGIARVPSFKEDDFKDAMRALMDPLGGCEEFCTDVHEAGGEFYSEISAHFEDEETAGMILEKLNGTLCLGRLLQMSYAPCF